MEFLIRQSHIKFHVGGVEHADNGTSPKHSCSCKRRIFNEDTIVSARIVYRGISSNFVHATKTENFLKRKHLFDNNVLQEAYKNLDSEIQPDYILPESKPEFRKLLAISLFYKLLLKYVPLAIRNALASARAEADPDKSKNYPFDGPTTVENTLSNSLNTFEQYVL